jgi:hypothetical protein
VASDDEERLATCFARNLDARESDSPPIRPVRFVALCNRAIRKGVISTGRYADYSGISRREAMEHAERDVIADVEVEVGVTEVPRWLPS